MKIELLAPAGGMEQLKSAIRFGADAIYGGMDRYGLRAYAGNFNDESIKEAVALAHEAGKQFYVTLNLLPTDHDVPGMVETAAIAHRAGADAAIVCDIGAMAEMHRQLPGLPLHVSTQANVLNSYAAKHLHDTLGVTRVVLSRELDMETIALFHKNIPSTLEIEAFVHGAMCVAYSGRCLLSSTLHGRSGNRGACTQPCRWKYHVVEEKRPNEYMPIYEDEHGTQIFSAYDLCMLEYLPEMLEAGITSLKIEGRMKTAYYVATVVSVYRHALDTYLQHGKDSYARELPYLIKEIKKASHRKSNTGFYFGQPTPAAGAEGFSQTMQYVGDVLSPKTDESPAVVEIKNRIFKGDTLEVLTPKGSYTFEVEEMTGIETGEALEKATVAGTRVFMNLPDEATTGDLLRVEKK